MEESLLLRFTGDAPLFRMIDFLIENKGLDYSKTGIAEGASISKGSVFNHWDTLEEFNIVAETRQFGKTKLYKLNAKSPVAKKLLELEKTLISESMKRKAHPRMTT